MQSATTPELPTLDPGIQLLAGEDRAIGPLHSLVVDHVVREGGPAYWVDVRGHARTRPLARIAPSRHTLDRIAVARGFTAFQHYALVDCLQERIAETDASLVVLPALDRPYRADDLRGDEGQDMLVRAVATVAGIARRYDVPVLATRSREDPLAEPVGNAAHRELRYEDTPMGPRFVGDDFETLVYPTDDGTVQTTLAFWERILEARAADHGIAGGETTPDTTTLEVTVGGSH